MGFGLSVRVRVPSSPRITSIAKAPPASAPPTMPSVTDTSRESSRTSSTTPAGAPLWLLSNSEIHTSSRRERKRSSRSRACTPDNSSTAAKSVSSPPEEPVVSPEPRTRARKRSKRHLWRLPVDHSPAALSRWSTTPDTKNRTREKNERRYHKYLAVSEITFPILLNPFRYSLLQR